MTHTLRGLYPFAAILALLLCLGAISATANGPIGDHVNDMQAHLTEYAEEVDWLLGKVDNMVSRYADGGAGAAKPEALVDHWEAVKFHAAIESNYVPIYASIWQGLFGVRLAMEAGAPVSEVQEKQALLEQSLWQGLGAVKMAAQLQERGFISATEQDEDVSPAATLDIIKSELDRVVAKYAERLADDAIEIVHDTYLTRFEGVEGALIEEDADLVEDLELDFNVTLPQAIQNGGTVDDVRAIVAAMQAKLERAKSLLETAQRNRSSVF